MEARHVITSIRQRIAVLILHALLAAAGARTGRHGKPTHGSGGHRGPCAFTLAYTLPLIHLHSERRMRDQWR